MTLPNHPAAVIVTDLDGTIVGADGSISQATIQAADALTQAGIPLLLATARTPIGVLALTPLSTYATIAICCNGAIGYQPRTNTTIWQHEIPPDALRAVIATITRDLPEAGVGLYDGRQWLLAGNCSTIRGKTPTETHAIVTDHLPGYRGVALAICHPTLTSAGIAQILRAMPAIDHAVTISHGGDDILDITPAGIDKGTGLRDALSRIDLDPALSIAFGDALNDLPMFHAAGRSIAVANAHPSALAAADLTTCSVADDGFHAALKALGIIQASDQPE